MTFSDAASRSFARAFVFLVLVFAPIVWPQVAQVWGTAVAVVSGHDTGSVVVGEVATPGPAPVAPVPVLPATGGEWWLTIDCPPQVASPCLDPTVEGEPGLPVDVAAQVLALVDAEWLCLDSVGEAMPDESVRVTDPQLQLCRQYAYFATREGGGRLV